MEEPTSILQHLPDAPLPAGAPKVELRPDEFVEIYGQGDDRTVIILRPTTSGPQSIIHIREAWLSVEDPTLASALIQTIKQRHQSPDVKLVIKVEAQTNPTLFNQVKKLPILAQTMVKPVDGTVSEIPPGLKWRDMQVEDTEPFLKQITEQLAENSKARREVKEEWDAAMKTMGEMMKQVLPEGAATAGHTFAVVEDTKNGEKVGVLWVALEDGKKSFCYDVEVEEGMRGKGLGKELLVIWEAIAAEQGATNMKLNVNGDNTVALKLYRGAGFEVDFGLFILDTNT